MPGNPVCIRTFVQRLEAEMAQSYLESQGIRAIVAANDAGGMQSFLLAGMGGVRLLVAEERANEALALLDAQTVPVEDRVLEVDSVNSEPSGDAERESEMKVAKACWECGSEEIYWHTTNLTGQLAGLLPRIATGFLGLAECEVYVCARCGYYRIFIPEKYLAEISQKWEKY